MREHILEEIRRVTAANGGKPPGRGVFEEVTGISRHEWLGRYWARWGDALEEAGFKPNEWQAKLSGDALLEEFAAAIRHFNKVPSTTEMRMFGRERSSFPGHTTFNNHFGSKAGLIEAFRDWASDRAEYTDLVDLLPAKRSEGSGGLRGTPRAKHDEGYVYLLKSGDHYKIGRSDNVEKRIKQITIAMPEDVTLVHTIRTDDPPGIEAYWHRRFADRRAKGEWFKLIAADLKAFKRRKFQ